MMDSLGSFRIVCPSNDGVLGYAKTISVDATVDETRCYYASSQDM